MEELAHKRGESCFFLMVSGQIETAEFISISNVYCKYFYVYGPDWRQVGGDEEGITPTGYKRERGGGRITLNTPIEGTFCSTNPFRWPQIVLSFYGYDLFGNDVIRGYSVTHLPTVPGRTERKCPIFMPQTSTAAQKLFTLFTGRRAEFVDPKIVAMAEGRDVTRVTTHGSVELSLTTTLKDVQKIGYCFKSQTNGKIFESPLVWQSVDNSVMKQSIKAKNPEGKQTTEARGMEYIQEHHDEPTWAEQSKETT